MYAVNNLNEPDFNCMPNIVVLVQALELLGNNRKPADNMNGFLIKF